MPDPFNYATMWYKAPREVYSKNQEPCEVMNISFGLAIVAFGIYFQNWWGALGIVFILPPVINWCHGLFTFKKLNIL